MERRVENCRGGDEKKRGLMEKWIGLLGELEEHQENPEAPEV